MSKEADLIRAEIPTVENIVRDECRIEGQQRGRNIDPGKTRLPEQLSAQVFPDVLAEA